VVQSKDDAIGLTRPAPAPRTVVDREAEVRDFDLFIKRNPAYSQLFSAAKQAIQFHDTGFLEVVDEKIGDYAILLTDLAEKTPNNAISRKAAIQSVLTREIQDTLKEFERTSRSSGGVFGFPSTWSSSLVAIPLINAILKKSDASVVVPVFFPDSTKSKLRKLLAAAIAFVGERKTSITALAAEKEQFYAGLKAESDKEIKLRETLFGGEKTKDEWKTATIYKAEQRLQELKTQQARNPKPETAEKIDYLDRQLQQATIEGRDFDLRAKLFQVPIALSNADIAIRKLLFPKNKYWTQQEIGEGTGDITLRAGKIRLAALEKRIEFGLDDLDPTGQYTDRQLADYLISYIDNPARLKKHKELFDPPLQTLEPPVALFVAQVAPSRMAKYREAVTTAEQQTESGAIIARNAPTIAGVEPTAWQLMISARPGITRIDVNDPKTYDYNLEQSVLKNVQFSKRDSTGKFVSALPQNTQITFQFMARCVLKGARILRLQSYYFQGMVKCSFEDLQTLKGVTIQSSPMSRKDFTYDSKTIDGDLIEADFSGSKSTKSSFIVSVNSIVKSYFNSMKYGDVALRCERAQDLECKNLESPSVVVSTNECFGIELSSISTTRLQVAGKFYGTFYLDDLKIGKPDYVLSENMSQVDLSDCEFDPACRVDFYNSDLSGANLSGITFYAENTRFKGCNLRGARMTGCTIIGALKYVDFSQTDMSDVDLSRASWDHTVKMPSGFEFDPVLNEKYRRMVSSGSASPARAKQFLRNTVLAGGTLARGDEAIVLEEYVQPQEQTESTESEDDYAFNLATEVFDEDQHADLSDDDVAAIYEAALAAFDSPVDEYNGDLFVEELENQIKLRKRPNRSRARRFSFDSRYGKQ